jgi:hypothetical protein
VENLGLVLDLAQVRPLKTWASCEQLEGHQHEIGIGS